MKKFLPLLLCLSLSIFTIARATKLTLTTRQQADAKTFFKHANTEEEVSSDNDDSVEGAPNDDGENTADDNADNAAGDQDTGNDDGANDNGADDDAGDDGGGDGGQ
jgi:hypothetical protein